MIAIDTYRQPYIPFQVTTREFFPLVRSHLTPDAARRAERRAPSRRPRPARRDRRDRSRASSGRRGTWDALRFNTLLFAFERPGDARGARSARRRGPGPVRSRSCRCSAATGRARRVPRHRPHRRPRARRVARRPRDRLVRRARRPARGRPPADQPVAGRKPRCRSSPIDLLHLGNERVIGVYVVDTPEGPALFDCGPATCFERLREAVDLREIRHLLLSHIHLDHAGAAGHVVRAHPQIRVHVSEIGAPHVIDPVAADRVGAPSVRRRARPALRRAAARAAGERRGDLGHRRRR